MLKTEEWLYRFFGIVVTDNIDMLSISTNSSLFIRSNTSALIPTGHNSDRRVKAHGVMNGAVAKILVAVTALARLDEIAFPAEWTNATSAFHLLSRSPFWGATHSDATHIGEQALLFHFLQFALFVHSFRREIIMYIAFAPLICQTAVYNKLRSSSIFIDFGVFFRDFSNFYRSICLLFWALLITLSIKSNNWNAHLHHPFLSACCQLAASYYHRYIYYFIS